MQNMRTVYGQTLLELGKNDSRVVVLEADLGKSTMTAPFQVAYPERYFEMGIAEANMASTAAGLALTGKTAFINSFAVFASGRVYDQIRQGICIPKLNVKIVGSSSGLSDFGDGATHQSVEDIAIMRAIPNMCVLVPADANETREMVRAIAEYKGPVYLKINRNELPDIYPEGKRFEIGEPLVVREGSDLVVFACGLMVSKALKAAEMLEKEGISVRLVNVSTLKPFNDDRINELSTGFKGIITAEEHSIIGGLAAAVAFALKGSGIPMEAIAIDDLFGQSALNYDDLLVEYGLTENDIILAAKKLNI